MVYSTGEAKSLEHNRSVKMMERINKVVNWRNAEALLLEHYEVGRSKEGADAYSPPGIGELPYRGTQQEDIRGQRVPGPVE